MVIMKKRSFLKYLAMSSLCKHLPLLYRRHWSKQFLRQRHDSDGRSESGPFAGEEETIHRQNYVNKSQLFSFLQFVELHKLSTSELLIHSSHVKALERGEDTYKDPSTGNVVFTRLSHMRRGNCCGSACRHCPYGHESVPPERSKKTYNSAFYV